MQQFNSPANKTTHYVLGTCGNRISVRFLKIRTEPKPKGQTRNLGFCGISQNRTCLIQIVGSIKYIYLYLNFVFLGFKIAVFFCFNLYFLLLYSGQDSTSCIGYGQGLSHSHKALTFFTLQTQDSGMIGII